MIGYFRLDADGEWYFVPDSRIIEFDTMLSDVYHARLSGLDQYEYNRQFIDKFSIFKIKSPAGLKVEILGPYRD